MAYGQRYEIKANAIYSLFGQAVASKLKYPHIRLQTANGSPVTLKLAGSMSKYRGEIMITNGGQYGTPNNVYYGRITTQGVYISTDSVTPDVLDLLARLGDNPAQVAADYGKLTGNCCFCGLKLDDARSTAVGYGPVCAKHFGLAWGKSHGWNERPRDEKFWGDDLTPDATTVMAVRS